MITWRYEIYLLVSVEKALKINFVSRAVMIMIPKLIFLKLFSDDSLF